MAPVKMMPAHREKLMSGLNINEEFRGVATKTRGGRGGAAVVAQAALPVGQRGFCPLWTFDVDLGRSG